MLEALAFAPIHNEVVPTGVPAIVSPELTATVQRLAPAIPRIAALFGVEIAPKAQMPRPLRNEWRDKKAKTTKKPVTKPATKPMAKPTATPATVPTETVSTETVSTEAVSTETVSTETVPVVEAAAPEAVPTAAVPVEAVPVENTAISDN